MLAALLLMCLMAPHYWETTVLCDDATINAAAHEAWPTMALSENWGTGNSAGANFDALALNAANAFQDRWVNTPGEDPLTSLAAAPTIEQLVNRRGYASASGDEYCRSNREAYEWPLLLQPTDSQSLAQSDGPVLEAVGLTAEETALFSNFGEVLANWLPIENVPQQLSMLGNAYEELFAEAPVGEPERPAFPAHRSTVRIVSPDDRLAMLPEPRELDGSHAWCVPQTLFELLERLASQADSAQWASHVTNQLRALTSRELLDGDDVQSILADLSDSAQEAIHMADQTENDALRVELLRTHWGLARRLDCWGAMHEKRVAERFKGRVAARGSLGPYFGPQSSEADQPADSAALSHELEKYEVKRDPKLGRYLAEQQLRLKSSPDSIDRQLADAVEQHYRNANIRIAITAEMLNRVVAEQRTEVRGVRDRIAGTVVRGQSTISSQSHVLLDPSSNDWQLELQANGTVESNTLAGGGPVQFRSRGTTEFTGRKRVVIDDKGVRLQQSKVDSSSRNRLVGVTTDYDWVPVVGSYTRDRAMSEYRSRQSRVRSETEQRVVSQVEQTLDQATQKAIDEIRQQTYDRFASQLDEFDIKLTPVEMQTTPDRLVTRLRVASEKQLGSHTPRPRALSDSLASAQIHESALTNLAITLGLDGKRYTGPELQKILREKFSQSAAATPIESHRDTIFEFARQDSVQVHINNGKFELTISFAGIEMDGDAMPNVVVHAYYVPAVDGLNAELVRDGAFGIEGRFSSSDRARLHNLFNRVLPPERHLPIVRIADPRQKQLDGLMITQLVLEDGWLGLAVGPSSDSRVAERLRSLR